MPIISASARDVKGLVLFAACLFWLQKNRSEAEPGAARRQQAWSGCPGLLAGRPKNSISVTCSDT